MRIGILITEIIKKNIYDQDVGCELSIGSNSKLSNRKTIPKSNRFGSILQKSEKIELADAHPYRRPWSNLQIQSMRLILHKVVTMM